MKQILLVFISLFMSSGCSKPVNDAVSLLTVDRLENDDPILEVIEEGVEQKEVKIDDETIIKIDQLLASLIFGLLMILNEVNGKITLINCLK